MAGNRGSSELRGKNTAVKFNYGIYVTKNTDQFDFFRAGQTNFWVHDKPFRLSVQDRPVRFISTGKISSIYQYRYSKDQFDLSVQERPVRFISKGQTTLIYHAKTTSNNQCRTNQFDWSVQYRPCNVSLYLVLSEVGSLTEVSGIRSVTEQIFLKMAVGIVQP